MEPTIGTLRTLTGTPRVNSTGTPDSITRTRYYDSVLRSFAPLARAGRPFAHLHTSLPRHFWRPISKRPEPKPGAFPTHYQLPTINYPQTTTHYFPCSCAAPFAWLCNVCFCGDCFPASIFTLIRIGSSRRSTCSGLTSRAIPSFLVFTPVSIS